MPHLRLLLVLSAPILLGLLAIWTEAPFIMTAGAPSGSKPWADAPMKLLETPQPVTDKTDMFHLGATHMGLMHNAILRGYNSVYQQAKHVRDEDKAAFIGYALTWHKLVKSHHDDEEAELFTKVEELLGEKVFEATHHEHQAFLPGLAEYHKYLTTLKSPADFSGAELHRVMALFQDAFESHFHSEIGTIASLAAHPRCPAPGTPEEATASAAFERWGKNTLLKAGLADVVPFFLLNLDGTREGGRWQRWPPMPAPIRWGLTNVAGALHGAWWKFSSCDAAGRPRELYALQFPERED